LTPLDIKKWHGELLQSGRQDGQPLSVNSVKLAHRVLHRAMADAVRWNLIVVNPLSAVRVPKGTSKELKVWTADEAGLPYHPQRFTKLFADAVAKTGVPKIRLHDTRHTMATLALEAGVHPKVVQEQLGHSAIAVTLDTYSQVPQAVKRDSADKIAGLFG
jgi:integrase